VVGGKANATASVVPFMVPSNPRDPSPAQPPLSIAMMTDPTSDYFAILDREGGQITNAQNLGLLTAGVGTGVNGLPIPEHQPGFNSPSGGPPTLPRPGQGTALQKCPPLERRLIGLLGLGHLVRSLQRRFRASVRL